MTFEDAVGIVHALSEKLASLVEVKGEAVMLPETTSAHKTLKEAQSALEFEIIDLIDELDQAGIERLLHEIGNP